MRFEPWHCPTCGAVARGTQETIPGIALLTFDDEGDADYEGTTEVDWDGQATVVDRAGNAMLCCSAGHTWPALAALDFPAGGK